MKVSADRKLKQIRIKAENADDLWELYNVLYVGDIIVGRTTREVKTSTSSWRRPVTLTLRIEWAEMQPMGDRLRVHGIILECPEDLDARGKHHTLTIKPGDEVVLIKDKSWSDADVNRLKEAQARTPSNVFIVSVDDTGATIAALTNSGMAVIFEEENKLIDKAEGSIYRERLKELAAKVAAVLNEKRAIVVAFVGPSFFKDDLKDEVVKLVKGIRAITADTSYGGYAGILEAMKRDEIKKAFVENQVIFESSLVEEFTKRIAKDEPIAYGIDAVEAAARAGAVETLVVSRDILQNQETRQRVMAVMDEVYKRHGVVRLFSANREALTWLNGFGGIAALLRFSVS